MKVPILEKFLCCMSLATGGQVVGWTCIVISSLEFLSGTKNFILTAGRNVNLVPDEGSPFAKLATSVIFFVLYVLYCGLVIYSAWLLIEGSKEGRPKKVILIMALFSFDIICNFVLLVAALINWLIPDIVKVVVSMTMHLYFLLVVYSLYKKVPAPDVEMQTQDTK